MELTHYCPVCKRVLPHAPGVERRAFITIGVAHACLGGTRFHKWYEPGEQEDNLRDLMVEMALDAFDRPHGLCFCPECEGSTDGNQ